jgi:uncharacterized RDD family membrane protein YckC
MSARSFKDVYRWLMVACVSGAAGAVTNIVLFFLAVLLFAGNEGDSWERWYFGSGNGVIFLSVTIVFSLVAFPFFKRLRLV